MPLYAIANRINVCSCTTSDDGYFTYLNPHWNSVLGWSLQEIIAMPFIDYVHPEDRELTSQIYQQILDGADIISFRNRYRTRSGGYVWLQWFANNLPEGGIVASAYKIDEVAFLENNFKQHIVLLEQVISLEKLGHWNLNIETKEIFWSKEAHSIYGVAFQEYIPELELAIISYHPDYLQKVTEHINNAFAEGNGWNLSLIIIRSDGKNRAVKFLADISRDLTDNPSSVFDVFQDVTEYQSLNKQVKLLVNVANISNAEVMLCDNDGIAVWINKAITSLMGYVLDELVGARIEPLLLGQNKEKKTLKHINCALEKFKKISVETLNHHKNGDEYWGHLLLSPFKDSEGTVTHILGIQNDITEKNQAEEKLTLAASVFKNAQEGILITNAIGVIIEVNDAFSHITGYTPKEVLGGNTSIFQSDRHTPEFYAEMWDTLLTKDHWRGEIWSHRKNGEIYTKMLTISAVKNTAGLVHHFVSLFTDITLMKVHHVQLERMAFYDALTNLPNRVLLADLLGQAMVQCQGRNRSLVVAFLDLDGFKAINDNYGHSVGDELLIAVSHRLKAVLRECDTLARIGGDEFVAVMVDFESIEESELLLKRLLQAAASPITLGHDVVQVSASIGLTLYPQDGVDADQLIRQADQAMYVAKEGGKNRYHLFDTAQNNAVKVQQVNIENISAAIDRSEFVLHYQPKVNMHTGEVVGVEALIRWQHPVNGLVPPLEFLPTIEDNPVSLKLGEWVIDTALKQICQWRNVGVNLPISVNLSAYQLQQDNFTSRLAELLAEHPDVPPNFLELEILETSALHDLSQVSATMDTCHDLGVCFALDDFGTGYSSFTYLRKLPAYLIKIDQSFVRNMLEEVDDLAIVEGIVGLAKAFRREVIAEGVETIAHGVALLQLGCKLAQGYGIARPMPSADIPEWVSNWKADDSWRMIDF